ncbi:MAG: HAD family hydrolase [Erysipelotrichaceae bacterium]|nr:HAD family hydrolase [Erysipelotrichaceae bacterium]
MIKGILFDFDGTLSNRVESAYRKYKDDVIELFPHLDKDGVEIEAIVQRCMTWDEYGTINKKHVYEQLKSHYNLDYDVKEMIKKWYDTFHLYQVLQNDCIDILKKLKKKYRLGIITNGDSNLQRKKIEYLGLDKYFEFVLVSGDKGNHKPDKTIFIEGAQKLGLSCEEVAFVGDTYATDILGAYRANMMPIWYFNDPLRFSDSNVTRIYNFEELLEIFDYQIKDNN